MESNTSHEDIIYKIKQKVNNQKSQPYLFQIKSHKLYIYRPKSQSHPHASVSFKI